MSDFLKQYGTCTGPLGFPMTDPCARAVEQLLKTLPKDQDHAYRKLVTVKGTSEINPGERSDVSWISTESPDRDREVVLSKGMNDSQFARNPLVTLNHNYYTQPVGKSLWRKSVKDGERRGIKAKTVYPEMPEGWGKIARDDQGREQPWASDKVFTLVQAGLLNGKSIGFLPLKIHYPDEKELQKNGWKGSEVRTVIDEWLLLEYSCVFLPANQDALVEAISKGIVQDFPPELWKALGLDGPPVPTKGDPAPAPPPAPPAPPPGSPVPFTPIAEVKRAVELALAKFTPEAIIAERVQEIYSRMKGRV